MKLLSIAVPSYNSQDYLDRCIESLLPGGSDVEILIIDDGSKDRTAEIADRYAQNYPDIVRAIHQENGGHGDAVTTGLKNAQGAFFKVCDSDDRFAKDAYLKILDFLRSVVEEKKDLDLLISNYIYDKQGVPEDKRRVIDYKHMLPSGKFFTWDDVGNMQIGHYILMHSVIYRTKMLHDMNLTLPKHTFYVDNIYVYEPLVKVKTMYYLDVNLYLYYIGRDDQSVNTEVMKKRIDQQDRVNRIMFDYMDLYSISNRRLRKYMFNYLQIMCTITSSYYSLIATPEAKKAKREIWAYMRKKNFRQYLRLRFSLLGLAVNLPGRGGDKIIQGGFRIARNRFGFN